MFFHIDPQNGLAVYDQVVRQVIFAVADGAVRTGELVPSVRELAHELAINPNTVARAYRQLQDDGVLDSIRGTGLAVATGARRKCQSRRTKLLRERLSQVLVEMNHSGLGSDEIEGLVKSELTASTHKRPGRSERPGR
jgi:GntR family transcriptional regulator